MMAFTGMMVLVTFAIGAMGASGLEVQTVPSVSLVSGKKATLTCGYNRSVFAVYWRYKPTSTVSELLVALDKHYQVGQRSGTGYEEGRFNITDDYSLIIHNVQADDDGEYICEVSDFKTGRAVRNSTEVSVIVMAEHTFPLIGQCDDDASPCTLHTYKGQHIIELTCSVRHVKPAVELSWTSAEQVGKAMSEASMKTTNNGDGVFDQTLTITIDTSKFHTDINDFICTAKGLAVSGKANHSISIDVTPIKGLNGAVTGLIVFGVLIIAVSTIVVCAASMIWYPKSQMKLNKQRSSINNYRSKQIATNDGDDRNITTLGVFGSAKSGKSSFINYIIFALTETDGKATSTEEKAVCSIEKIELTENIEILNFKGTVKDTVDEFFLQFEGHPLICERTNIDCPIFVCSSSMHMDMTEGSEKISKPLPTDLCTYFGTTPMVVITNKDKLGKSSQMKAELIKTNGLPKDNIFIFENFKLESHTLRSSKLLAFILRCLKDWDGNKQCGPDQSPNEESPLNQITSKD